MKKIILLLSILVFVSCKQEKPTYSFNNTEQQKFVELFNESEIALANNSIQNEEMSDKFKKKIDSIADKLIMNNWTGQITNIKTFEIQNSTELNFVISFKISETDKISFKTSYLLDSDKKESDPLFNKIKNLSEYSTVFFDGFIKTDLFGNTEYFNENDYTYMVRKNKDFYFNTINISTEPTPVFSKNIIISNTVALNIFNLLDEKLSKKIKPTVWELETKKLVEEAKNLPLTKEEQEITNTYKQYLYIKFMGLY